MIVWKMTLVFCLPLNKSNTLRWPLIRVSNWEKLLNDSLEADPGFFFVGNIRDSWLEADPGFFVGLWIRVILCDRPWLVSQIEKSLSPNSITTLWGWSSFRLLYSCKPRCTRLVFMPTQEYNRPVAPGFAAVQQLHFTVWSCNWWADSLSNPVRAFTREQGEWTSFWSRENDEK